MRARRHHEAERGVIPSELQGLCEKRHQGAGEFKNDQGEGLREADHLTSSRNSIAAGVRPGKGHVHVQYQSKPIA